MAPALPLAPRDHRARDPDAVRDTEPLPLRRRALASVNNLSTHMEEDDMGLQNQPSLAKDSQEMEQIMVELGSSDLGQADLLQVIKTLETGGDSLSTGDPDAIFPLSGFDLTDTADSEGDTAEDKIKLVQARLERRCSFLQRRLRILQARAIGKRVSDEVAQTFEKCTRGARKDGGGRPVGLKAFLKRVETTAALQASAASHNVVGPKYYRAGTSTGDVSRSATVGIASGTLTGLEDTAGALRSHLSVVKRELDSDATASSSGAESNDEAVTYNNPHQQQMPIEKRALWRWQKERASVASRWSWLQAQVQELDYKIRQHTELHRQVREAKGPVEFEGEPAGYSGALPGQEGDDPSCARVRPLRRETFRKRKLLQMHNLHIATNKAAKPSDIKCGCSAGEESCPVCTGRAECTQPAPAALDLPPAARLAALDPGYHPVLSDIKDVPPEIHQNALWSRAWFRGRWARPGRSRAKPPASSAPSAPASAAAPAPAPAAPMPRSKRHPPTHYSQRHPPRLKRGRPPLSRKIRDKDREDETSTSGHERSRGRSSTETRWRRQSYDIDNIVIPQSMAANTRPQILTYKEIITPKWRLLDVPETPMNNGVMKSHRISVESEDEDISEAAVAARHLRAEGRERARYARKQRARRTRTESAEGEGPATPGGAPVTPVSPGGAPPTPSWAPASSSGAPALTPRTLPEPQTSTLQIQNHETVRPYTPRQFPLGEDTYMDMLSAMPEGYQLSPRSPHSPPSLPSLEEDDDSSTLSQPSPHPFDGDDPDDMEWDPSAEKSERRKSTFR